jgi:hypothetical protein
MEYCRSLRWDRKRHSSEFLSAAPPNRQIFRRSFYGADPSTRASHKLQCRSHEHLTPFEDGHVSTISLHCPCLPVTSPTTPVSRAIAPLILPNTKPHPYKQPGNSTLQPPAMQLDPHPDPQPPVEPRLRLSGSVQPAQAMACSMSPRTVT